MIKNILLIGFFVFIAFSKSHAINLQKFHFSNSPGFATLEDGLLSEGFITTDYKYIVVASYNYVRAPFIEVDGTERSKAIIEWMHTMNLGGAYRLSDKMQLGLSTFATYENFIPGDSTDDKYKTAFVLGDTTIDFKYKLFEKDRFAISFTPRVSLPTGDSDTYTSNDSTGYYAGFALDKAFSFFQIAANIGHKENQDALYEEVDHRRQFHFSIGAIFPLFYKLDITAEFFRDTPYESSNEQIPSEANAGIRYNHSNDTALFAGMGTGSLEESNSTDVRLYAGLKYFPSSKKKSEKIIREEKVFGKFYKDYNIYFATAVDDPKGDEDEKLSSIASRLKDDPYISKIVIEGYASRMGTKERNKKLSRNRSQNIKKRLLERGILVQNIELVAYGDERADKDELNKDEDRRVMIRIYRKR